MKKFEIAPMSPEPPAEALDRALLRDGVEHANIPALLMVLVQLTGERHWLDTPFTPKKGPGLDDNDSAGLDDARQREVRAAAWNAIEAWLDGQPIREPRPDSLELAHMLSVAMSEPVPGEYGEIIAAGLDRKSVEEQHRVNRPLRAIIIGAGISGLCAAVNLRAIGIDCRIFEKNPDVGGTWWENRYPGCGVDTPNLTYTFSFAEWDWAHYFPLQSEILEYLDATRERFGIDELVEFSTDVERAVWDDDKHQWAVYVTAADGTRSVHHADLLVSAVGILNRPQVPDIPGLDSFTGTVAHTSDWPADLDLKGKKVAVVGNGASGMQVVPAIAPDVAELTIFARSKQWAAPFPQFRKQVPESVRYLLAKVPLYRFWYEQRLAWTFNDRIHSSLFKDPDWADSKRSLNAVNDAHRRHFTRYVHEQLGDRQDLIDKVLPDFPPFTKRMLLDNGWYRTLLRDNVRLIPDRLARVEGRKLTAANGEESEADVILLATGFKAAEVLGSYEVIGRDGRVLRDEWEVDNASAYLGSVVPGFPNFFILLGPNVGSGHGGSMIRSIENQTHYMIDAIRQLTESDAKTIEVREEVYRNYAKAVDDAHDKMVWTHPGAENWYRNKRGRIVAITPWRNDMFWRMTRAANPADYRFG
jgi:4-hydroxyacetophenone monooxygenase